MFIDDEMMLIKININFFYVLLLAEQEVKLEDIKLKFVAV